ncbi:PREDICTED: bromodomain adjacent to zinc finger domain protein 1A isoform X3 [Dinoponera quadriceps]|uniref:Bromodomain adjacent to zinc finger domain protein 1A n=1 Tax=Dinoponera quadriceps TaxID=609295 RepID=A0A6P3WZN2_DINQU|nr:PREDICTED: bromodomain adjacent to zinc finger domain protein 1A isoform X3 [Dinoponera quadriceps]
MPLLRKQPFQRLHVSSDFRDDDEVFYCEVTNEIFKDYNEFCARIILCNSLIWSCSITGRTSMTFQEALECEENAKKSLKEFPMELRIPILYLASKTNRMSFNEMIEDVYQFARDRYFVGEMVEASFTEESWCNCHVLQVIVPSEQQVSAYLNENGRSLQENYYHPPAKLFRYEVEQLDSGDSDVSQLMIVEASQVRRRKQHYSRERNKIFLRQLCEQNTNGIWVVKDSVLKKYGINKVRFDTIFAGTLPDFTVRVKRSVKQKQESINKFLTTDVSKQKTLEKTDLQRKASDTGKVNEGGVVVKKFRKPRMNGKFKEELKAKALEEKAKRKEERALRSEHLKEKKQKLAALAAYMKQWNKPREDLECEDLCPIPEPTVIKCNIPNEKFGDFAMILEFLQFFSEELEVSAYFAGGFNLELLEKALLTKEASGPWSDLLQLLLINIFKYQKEEDSEIDAQAASILLDNISPYEGASSMAKAVKLATMASRWCPTYQGCKLSELTVDHVTLSEILRQHLLSSGGRISEAASKWRYSQKGGYTNFDEPALLLRINEEHILRLLGHRNVCELDLDDKIKIATCLINQLLTFAPIRDAIEERHDKLHQAKRELKLFLLAEQKKEKEEKEKMREREKEGKLEEEDPKPKKVTRGNYEEEKKKEEYENKLKELQQASRDDKMMLYLGADRCHRRYWRYISIPGVFVENDEWWPGSCLPEGTPHHPELQDKEATYAYLKNKFEDEFSDKENSFKKSKKSPKKLAPTEKNGVKSLRKEANRKEFKQDLTNIKRNLILCTGDKDCPVHCKRSQLKWSFYGNQEDIQALINSLSTRGIRESDLRNNLIQEMDSLLAIINECPKHRLNPDVFPDPDKGQINKATKKNKYENANLNFPSEVAVDEVMELTLRDYILDFEDKIKAGCLGCLKIIDREVWRNAINQRGYDKQCDKLIGANGEIDIDAPANILIDKIKNESKYSRPGTPDSEVGSISIKTYRDPGMYLGLFNENETTPDQKQQATIKQLACAILQLSHGVEQRYLLRPLGPDQKDKKWSGEEARERWEQSLLASSSWSQLFVHLSTLENSVAWNRSVLNAQCRICRRRRDAENMLLCDECNKGHHLYCLKPKLNAVPDGDWFCTTCRPPTIKPKEKAQKRKRFEDEMEDEAILTKETRHNRAKRVVTYSDEEARFDQEDDDDQESDQDISVRSENLCTSCKSSGKLIACDTCPDRYHLECAEPPLSRAPRGRWSCVRCKDKRRNATRDSSTSEDTEPRQTRRATKRAAEIEHEEDKSSVKGCMARLQELLSDIRHHRDSWPFLSPVTKDEVPDYHDIISNPMDFGTIKFKLSNGDYERLDEFFSDCQLVFENCRLYNKEHSSVYSYVYRAGTRLLKYLEKRCKELGLDFDEALFQEPKTKRARLNGDGLEENGMTDSEDDEGEMQKRR